MAEEPDDESGREPSDSSAPGSDEERESEPESPPDDTTDEEPAPEAPSSEEATADDEGSAGEETDGETDADPGADDTDGDADADDTDGDADGDADGYADADADGDADDADDADGESHDGSDTDENDEDDEIVPAFTDVEGLGPDTGDDEESSGSEDADDSEDAEDDADDGEYMFEDYDPNEPPAAAAEHGARPGSDDGGTAAVTGLVEVVLEVESLDRAMAFYRALGMEVVDRGANRKRVRLSAGPFDFELWEPHLGLADARGGVHVDLGFAADVERAVDEWDGSLDSLTLGVRPEDLSDLSVLDEDEYTENSTLDAQVKVVEPMGSDKFLTVTSKTDEDTEFSARVAPESSVEPGEPISLSATLDKIHLFDDETGQNITY